MWRTFNSTLAVIQRNWRIDKKYVETFTWRLFWPVVNVSIMGFLALFVGQAMSAVISYNYIDYIIVGTMVSLLINSVFSETAHSLRREQWEETLEGVYLTPRGRNAILIGNLLYGVLFTLISVFALMLAGVFIFGVAIHGRLWDFALALFLTIFSIAGFGLIVSALTLKWKQSTTISFAIMDVLILVSGIYYPVTILPKIIQFISIFSPLTYALDITRKVVLDGRSLIQLGWQLLPLIVLATALIIVGMFIYVSMEQQVLRTVGLKQK